MEIKKFSTAELNNDHVLRRHIKGIPLMLPWKPKVAFCALVMWCVNSCYLENTQVL